MAMLTTVTSDGKIRSRPMVTKQIDETGMYGHGDIALQLLAMRKAEG